MLNATSTAVKMKCPSCGSELGDIPAKPQDSIVCPQCEYDMTWAGDCWDACIDKTYPRDFAKQWVLWEAGRLGDPNRVYGNDPQVYFRTLLEHTSLQEEDLASKKILEIGFGHGRLLRELQKWSPTAYGIDLSKPLKSAQLRPGSAFFGNLLNVPIMPGQFDLVICRGVIHVTPDPQESFSRVAEQVADGGMLYAAGLYEPGKGNLILRKIFPGVWNYPESIRLGMSSVFGAVRAAVEVVRKKSFSFKALRRYYGHYKLDIFDILAPRWTTVHAEDEVLAWFTSHGFVAKRVNDGDYVGIRTGA